MQVLEHQHRRPLRREALAEAPPRRERLLLAGGFRRRPDQRCQTGQQPGTLRVAVGDRLSQLRARRRGRIRFEDAALGLHDLPQGPENDPVAIRQAPTLPPPDQVSPGVNVTQELRTHPALPHTRLADQGHQLTRTLLIRPLERADQERLLQIPADERRRMRANDIAPEPGPSPYGPEDRKRLRLAFHRSRLQRFVLEHPLRLPVCLLRHRHPVHRGDALQPGRGIHDVAGDDAFTKLRPGAERDHPLACVHADPNLQTQTRVGLVEVVDRLQNPQARPDRPLRVVLVRHRRTEDRHHRIADELLHRPAEPLDLLPEPSVIGAQPRPHVLRVDRFRGGRKPDEVAEQHRDNLALLERSARHTLS